MYEFSNSPRIFVVDDDLPVALTLVRILRFGGYDAIPFTDSNEALRAARRTPPRLLLAEADMPSLSGIELAAAIRQSSPNCQIMLMSWDHGHPNELGGDRAAQLEFEVLEKPLRMAELLSKASSLLYQRKPPQPVPIPALDRWIA